MFWGVSSLVSGSFLVVYKGYESPSKVLLLSENRTSGATLECHHRKPWGQLAPYFPSPGPWAEEPWSHFIYVLYQLKLFFLKYTPTGQLSHYQLFMVHIDKLHGTGHACMFTYMCTLIHYILYIISVYSLISNHKNHYMSKLFEWCYSHHLVVSLLNKHPTHDCWIPTMW